MARENLNHYWKTVVDTIQDGVMIVSPQGIIISVNRGFEEITGFSRDEALGQSCAILNCAACETARRADGCNWCVMFKKGDLKKQKCVIIRKDGRPVHVVKNASVLKDEDGNVTGAVETLTDVTDLMDKETQIETFRRELDGEDRFHGMIGVSGAMQKVFELISDAAHSDAPVIIFGESGTGKELVAKAIHEGGHRGKGPYIKVNCAALNESLLESEMFGHVKGAFTGAHRSREGRFEAASKGSIFLDEIGDLPLSTQVKLLRVLEEKVVERVGDHHPITVDVRIISATNRDLAALIEQGRFREDFFYRINVIPINVPALRDRREDIPLLAHSFFNRMKLKSGKRIEGVSKDALDALMRYHWPGNVRELKSAFEFAFVSCQEEIIAPEHFPAHLQNEERNSCPAIAPTLQTLGEIKKQRLIEALRSAKGNQSETAQILGISRTSVWQQMKRFGLRPEAYKTS
ncbi:MAG: Fis family transcriptional regulator [Desulfatitalea sp. BRH_c12]|nr:MAG: Fis family transcriptional regulator [Desulfatitalea sp. BRH_c12]